MKPSLILVCLFIMAHEMCSQVLMTPGIDVMSELKCMKDRIKVLEEEMIEQRKEKRVKKDCVDITDYRMEERHPKNKVAFWATSIGGAQDNGPFEEDQIMVYRTALTNIGNGYDTNTGIFTAPVRGVYYFNIVVFNANSYATGVHIMKNKVRVAAVTDNPPGQDSEDTASNSVTLLLEKGDQVYNELINQRKIYTDTGRRNSFSGHLLYEMPTTE
ncbi:complement C1q-like protein 2 [Clarias gariepinus]|uniref:complement C1q-like protein 2 n=1 Tax=Clarias gariepinus TaxID=13013 RepID=UPI00234C0E9A|nr:complement C1q-like protein 2 [Clarias gariepinus]